MATFLANNRFRLVLSGRAVPCAQISQASAVLDSKGKLGFEPIVIRRALEPDSPLWQWWQAAATGPRATRTVRVELLGAGDTIAASWVLGDARPIRWSTPELDAMEPAPAMEELVVEYRSLELLSPKTRR